MKFYFLKILFLSFVCSNSLQGQVQFVAKTDAKEVALGDVFEVKFVLENGQGSRFTPPSFADFSVAGGPNRMNSMTMVNGVSSSSETISYVLQGKKEGKYSIGSASITVKGQIYTTTPIVIDIVKGKRTTGGNIAANAKDAVFIRAEASSYEARIGQQVILDYKLYTRVDLNGMNLLHEPSYDGFYYLEVNDYPHGENRVTISGKAYLTRILRRVALFPQREGEVVVEPMTVQVGIVTNRTSDPFEDPFFGGIRSQNHTIQSNSVNIQVKPLPNNAPVSFSGGVGEFRVQTSISKAEATTDDVISIKMQIIGNGDAKRWQAPKLPPIEGLEFYEPKVLKEESIESQGEWQATKEIEYLIVPKRAGTYTLKPEFSYFDTEGGQFKTIGSNTYNLTISQGKNPTATISADKIQDINAIKTKTIFTNQISMFYGSTAFWGFLILPFLFIGGVVGYKQILIQRSKIDTKVLKSQNASKVAERRLKVAFDFMQKGNHRLFYDEVSKAMFTYVSDKMGIPMSEFSKSSVEEKLKSLTVSDLHTQNFIKILNNCEMALFAGQYTTEPTGQNESNMQTLYQNALAVITDIENDLNKKNP
jgi:hypothetical protein